MAEKAEESPASEEGGKKSGKKKLIIVVLLLILLGGGGAGAFLFMGKKEDAEDKKEEHLEEERPQLVFAPLDPPFIVNLADSGSYLKATIYLEFDIERSKKLELDLTASAGHGSGGAGGGGEKGPPKLEGILKVKEPLVRDVVIRVLSSKTVDEARSTSQRDALKGELVEAINDVVGDGDGPVTNVIFTEYIVQ